MDPDKPQSAFSESMLGQDPPIPEAQFAEYRRRREGKLSRLARREKRMRVVTTLVWVIAFAGLLGGLVLDRLTWPMQVKDALYVVIATCSVCAVPFLLLYF